MNQLHDDILSEVDSADAIEGEATDDQVAPVHLSESAREWWLYIVNHYEIDGARELLLTSAMEAWDALNEMREVLNTEKRVVKDRFGKPKQHPAIAIEKGYRAQMHDALSKLKLDVEPTRSGPGRPSESRGSQTPGRQENLGGFDDEI